MGNSVLKTFEAHITQQRHGKEKVSIFGHVVRREKLYHCVIDHITHLVH